MAGLYTVSAEKKTISIGQLDQLMDQLVQQNNNAVTPAGMLKIALSFRALDIIAGAVSRMPYCIYKGETDVTEEETPRYWADLQYKLCESYLLFNQAYALKESNQYGVNSWRFLVAPAMQWLTNPATKQLAGFRYDNQPIDNYEKSLLWWWWPNVLAEVGPGTGPTDAALGDAALIKYLTDFASAYFQRGGFPVTLLQMSGPIAPDDQNKIESWWNSMIAGVKRAFRAVLITDKIKTTQIGSTIKETTAPELYEQSAENVALAYGIPIAKLMSSAAKYGNAVEKYDVDFITDTVSPIFNRMAEVWNERVYEPQGLKLVGQPEKLEIMQQYELQKAQTLTALVGGPIMTRAEARALMRYKEETETEQPTTPAPAMQPQAQSPEDDLIDMEGKTDRRVAAERERMKRKAHNCLRDGKAFTFSSDVVSMSDIEAVKACKTHEEIDALTFAPRDIGLDVLAKLEEAIAKAQALNE